MAIGRSGTTLCRRALCVRCGRGVAVRRATRCADLMAERLILVLLALALLAIWARGRWRAYCVSHTAVDDIDAAARARPAGAKVAGVACIAGASVSGLLAARICSNHFERVILYDSEECFPDARPRSRVRQHDQLHRAFCRHRPSDPAVFLALLWPTLKSLFPSFEAELYAQSGSVAAPASVSYKAGGFAMLPDSKSWTTRQIYTSREALEGLLRKLVLGLPNVEARVGTVIGFTPSSDRRRVTSVQVRRADGTTEDIAVAALIDASGTTNGSIGWLRKAGYEPPIKRTYECAEGFAAWLIGQSASALHVFHVPHDTSDHRQVQCRLASSMDRDRAHRVGFRWFARDFVHAHRRRPRSDTLPDDHRLGRRGCAARP